MDAKTVLIIVTGYQFHKNKFIIIIAKVLTKFGERASVNIFKTLIKQLRISHWLKNSLIFLPSFLSLNAQNLSSAIIAFLSFCFIASAGYLLNDYIDLDQDQKHAKKMKRPLAAGKIKLRSVFILFVLLLLFGFALTMAVPGFQLLIFVSIYFVSSIFYSTMVKNFYLIDIIWVALMMLIRIICGEALTNSPVSISLYLFLFFLFVGLTGHKRFFNLKYLPPDHFYKCSNPAVLHLLGLASGIVAIISLAFYIFEITQFRSQGAFWLYLIPALIAWWYFRFYSRKTHLDKLDDLFAFTLKDLTSWLIMIISVVIYFFT